MSWGAYWNRINTGLQIASAYDSYRTNQQNADAFRDLAQSSTDIQVQTLDDASRLLDEAMMQAIGFLEAGNAAAAEHIIAASKIASRHILEYADLSIDAQTEFYKLADEKLQPFVEQGLFAMDEYASMLGIPNSRGELVPYDVADLRETPGYQFQFEEGQRAVERSAVGRQLSGRQVKEQIRYGDGLAQLYFGQRLDQLAPLISGGQSAASQQSTNAFNAGVNIGNTYQQTGGALADLALWEGGGLAELEQGQGEALANLFLGNAQAQGNLAIGQGTAQSNLLGNLQSANNADAANRANAWQTFIGLAQMFTQNQNQTQDTDQSFFRNLFGNGSTSTGGQSQALTTNPFQGSNYYRNTTTSQRRNPFYGDQYAGLF